MLLRGYLFEETTLLQQCLYMKKSDSVSAVYFMSLQAFILRNFLSLFVSLLIVGTLLST